MFQCKKQVKVNDNFGNIKTKQEQIKKEQQKNSAGKQIQNNTMKPAKTTAPKPQQKATKTVTPQKSNNKIITTPSPKQTKTTSQPKTDGKSDLQKSTDYFFE